MSLTADTLVQVATDYGRTTTDATKPNYAPPAWFEMAPRWQLVDDIRAGTFAIRAKKQFYLPRFEAETIPDWDARVRLTFVAEHYATTLTEHVGLVMAEPIKFADDVPEALQALAEDIDGEGNHIDVFAQGAFDAALHYGHCVLFTDYPEDASGAPLPWTPPPGFSQTTTLAASKAAKRRPYVTLYPAPNILSWRTVSVGGVKTLVQIVFREETTEVDGEFGTTCVTRFREIKQDVQYDPVTGRAVALGAITWRAWIQTEEDETSGVPAAESFVEAGSGTITGVDRIAARVVYGGQRTGFLTSVPHLMGIAFANLEETQVVSDYAKCMHSCNVPTPVFIGRNTSPDAKQTVQMGQGIDIPQGGDAKILEPTGKALDATRQRLLDIQDRMRRQGAAMSEGRDGGRALTATEAAQIAKARNAKLQRAARSLQDALEGVLADMASFMGIATPDAVQSGGSVVVTQDFAGVTIDPAYLTVLLTAYLKGDALSIEELRYVLQNGSLPETFDPSDVLELLAQQAAKEAAAKAAAAQQMNGSGASDGSVGGGAPAALPSDADPATPTP